MSTFPHYILPRQHDWAGCLIRATAAAATGWPVNVIIFNDAKYPIRIIQAAPFLALSPRSLETSEDTEAFYSAYPEGCIHVFSDRLASKPYFEAVWRAVKRQWRGNLMIDPMKCGHFAEAVRLLRQE